MLDHILELKRKVSWVLGDVTCALYPIKDVDTVSIAKMSISFCQILQQFYAIDEVAFYVFITVFN